MQPRKPSFKSIMKRLGIPVKRVRTPCNKNRAPGGAHGRAAPPSDQVRADPGSPGQAASTEDDTDWVAMASRHTLRDLI